MICSWWFAGSGAASLVGRVPRQGPGSCHRDHHNEGPLQPCVRPILLHHHRHSTGCPNDHVITPQTRTPVRFTTNLCKTRGNQTHSPKTRIHQWPSCCDAFSAICSASDTGTSSTCPALADQGRGEYISRSWAPALRCDAVRWSWRRSPGPVSRTSESTQNISTLSANIAQTVSAHHAIVACPASTPKPRTAGALFSGAKSRRWLPALWSPPRPTPTTRQPANFQLPIRTRGTPHRLSQPRKAATLFMASSASLPEAFPRLFGAPSRP